MNHLQCHNHCESGCGLRNIYFSRVAYLHEEYMKNISKPFVET